MSGASKARVAAIAFIERTMGAVAGDLFGGVHPSHEALTFVMPSGPPVYVSEAPCPTSAGNVLFRMYGGIPSGEELLEIQREADAYYEEVKAFWLARHASKVGH